MSKRDHIYGKLKINTSQYRHNLQDRYREIKKEIHQKLRQSYWRYIRDMILGLDQPEDKTKHTGNKRFWSYINSRKAEKGGVASLKNEG